MSTVESEAANGGSWDCDIRDVAGAARYVRGVAEDLDPKSRYVTELLARVERSRTLEELDSLLSSGCRGLEHAGHRAFASMTLAQKLYTNLITSETELFRFEADEWSFVREAIAAGGSARPKAAQQAEGERRAGREASILVVPCSRGEEAYTIALSCLELGVPFSIVAIDLQPDLVDDARRADHIEGERQRLVRRSIADGRLRFSVGDAFELASVAPGPFDLVFCRNFIGYFVVERALPCAASMLERVGPGGLLVLDDFCVTKFPGLTAHVERLGGARAGDLPVFVNGAEIGRYEHP